MNPFRTIKNYSEMLVKIATYTFFVTVVLMIIIRANHAEINKFLLGFEPDFKIEIFNVEQSVLTVIIPFVLAFLSNWLKLHDKISTALRIRYHFDIKYILKVFCDKLDINYDNEKLYKNRRELMRLTFYKYASSREEDETISRHSIELAMNQWTSFWIVEEAIFFTLITIFILMFNRDWLIIFLLAIMIIAGIVIMYGSYKMSIRYAEDQIFEILENDIWKCKVKEDLNEVLSR